MKKTLLLALALTAGMFVGCGNNPEPSTVATSAPDSVATVENSSETTKNASESTVEVTSVATSSEEATTVATSEEATIQTMSFAPSAKSTLTSTEANLAAKLGMDASKVTVTGTPSANSKYSNDSAINTKSGDASVYEIRMYGGKDNTTNSSLTFTMASGYTIDSIKVVVEAPTAEGKTCNGKVAGTLVVTTGDTTLTGAEDVYTVNASSVKIAVTTDQSSCQVHVHEIVITYHAA